MLSSPPPMTTIATLPDALRQALVEVISRERLEWRRQHEVELARRDTVVAELRAAYAEMAQRVDHLVAERLAALKDGDPGPPGQNADPAVIAEMVASAVTQIPQPGPEEVRALVAAEVERTVGALPVPEDGHSPTAAELAPLIDIAVVRAVAALPRPEDGRSVEPAEVERLVAAAIAKLPPPAPGPEGPPGKFAVPKTWSRGIHYESALVAHRGSTWCAIHDTAEEPPHEDWQLVAARGVDGADAPVGRVCGLYDPTCEYRLFDLVTFRNAEWRARRDDPGPLPGEGWAISAQEGKRGERGRIGEPGPRGFPGPPGRDAPIITGWQRDGYEVVPVLEDGRQGAPLDLRALFELYHTEAT
jgi:hypothetical protein